MADEKKQNGTAKDETAAKQTDIPEGISPDNGEKPEDVTTEEAKSAETKSEEAKAGETNPADEKAGEADPDAADDGETDGNPQSGDEKSWADKRAAKKQARQDKKTDALKEQIEQLEDRVKRQMAEFENFRKRTDREKQAMFETGAKSVIEKILPIVDNFERGLSTVPEENREDPFVDGMNKVYRQMMTELDNIGVKPIDAVGQEFDPALHNAVMQVASEEFESGTVAQELQKGYTYRDSVVRHSMVAVVE